MSQTKMLGTLRMAHRAQKRKCLANPNETAHLATLLCDPAIPVSQDSEMPIPTETATFQATISPGA